MSISGQKLNNGGRVVGACAAFITIFGVETALPSDCDNTQSCPPIWATRGDIIYATPAGRPFDSLMYRDAAPLQQCLLPDGRYGAQVSPETCIRIGGLFTAGFSYEQAGDNGRLVKLGEAWITLAASTSTEFGPLLTVLTHKEALESAFLGGQQHSRLPVDEFYHSLGGFTIGHTYSLWDAGAPRSYADGSTFSWYGSRSRGSPLDRAFVSPLVRYVSSHGLIGYGVSFEGTGHLPYSYLRRSEIDVAAIGTLTLDTSWGGFWVKGAYDAAVEGFAAKGGLQWELPSGDGTARLLWGVSNGRSIYGEHRFGSWTIGGDWSIMGVYQHHLSDHLSGSLAAGFFGGSILPMWTTEMSVVWKPSADGEIRLEGASWHYLDFPLSGVTASVRLSRFF
jgi:hypothetical protein